LFIYKNGSSSKSLKKNCSFSLCSLNGAISFTGDEIFYQIENQCVELHQKLEEIFIINDVDLYSQPTWISQAGYDSDCPISSETFGELVRENNDPMINKYLFLCDCQALVSFLQNRIISSKNLFSLFYKELHDLLPSMSGTKKDSVYWCSGLVTENVFSVLYDLIITVYSILDQITKVAIEVQQLPTSLTSFTEYPKLSSKNVLFGQRKKIKQIVIKDSVFEFNDEIKIFEILRNELIHNSTWEANPKVFFEIKNSRIIEKFIFMPDIVGGRSIATNHNRKRFFASKNKINLELPKMCFSFWKRVKISLENIILFLSNFDKK
jgi:hypothetical protein